jgi:hypothetical protein
MFTGRVFWATRVSLPSSGGFPYQDTLNHLPGKVVDPVGRPKSDNPRDQVIHFRITAGDAAILDAMAAVQRTSGNEVAYQALLEALDRARRDDLVQEQLALHAKFDARKAAGGKVTPIARSPKSKLDEG